MPALISYHAYTMKKPIQYTIRNVPERTDEALRKLAVREGTSLNTVANQALEAGAGVEESTVRHHDLDDLAGTWVQDPSFDEAIRAFDAIDKGLWK